MDWKDKKFNYSSGIFIYCVLICTFIALWSISVFFMFAPYEKADWKKKFSNKSQSNTNISDNCLQFCCNSKSFNFSESFQRLGLEIDDTGEKNEKEEVLNSNRGTFIPSSQEPIKLCMCKDCLEEESKILGIKTREISSFRLVIQGPEILHYQGVKYSPKDVAPYWKKDSRMWLWKSVKYAQRQRTKSKSFPRFPVFSRLNEKQ